jgi:predicted AAA+ superfamily ATPase
MLIKRDSYETALQKLGLEALLMWGSRQVGKTTLLDQFDLCSKYFFDDLQFRIQANSDPAFLLLNTKLPCLLDEVQYVPNLFPEIKKRIDESRRENLKDGKKSKITIQYYLTGSNTTQLESKIQESLAGRCHLAILHGLSVKEIYRYSKDISLRTILYRGGLPALYTVQHLKIVSYLNDYIVSFIEKDVARGAGVEKLSSFQLILRLLAARSGQFLNVSELANTAGVDQKTVNYWIMLLEKNYLISLVSPYHSNLSKRLIKMKKIYFYDTGIAARLQGHQDELLLWNSPQAGALFETLVFSEIIKTRDNFDKDWRVETWRTKEQYEIDFVLTAGQSVIFIEAKLAIQNVKVFHLDVEAKKIFNSPYQKIIAYAGDKIIALDHETKAVPIHLLGEYLLSHT